MKYRLLYGILIFVQAVLATVSAMAGEDPTDTTNDENFKVFANIFSGFLNSFEFILIVFIWIF